MTLPHNTFKYLCSLLLLGALLSSQALAFASSEGTGPQPKHTADYPEFNVKIYGDGPPILLIPGLSSSGEVWDSTVTALKDAYELHVFTLAGFAGIEPLPTQTLQNGFLAAQENALLAYIDNNALEAPVFVGHSLGGFLGLKLALQSPQRFAGVVNVDGLPAIGALFAEMENGAQADTPQPNFDPQSMAQGMTNNPAWYDRIVADMMASDGMTSGIAMGELMAADLRQALSELRLPTLTLGALENGAPYATKAQVQSNYENQFAQASDAFHSIEYSAHSRHFIMADDPQWLNERIKSFLSSLASERR